MAVENEPGVYQKVIIRISRLAAYLRAPQAIAWELYCCGCCPDQTFVPSTDNKISRWLSTIEFINTWVLVLAKDIKYTREIFLTEIEYTSEESSYYLSRERCAWRQFGIFTPESVSKRNECNVINFTLTNLQIAK
jgi:hypothetical protein